MVPVIADRGASFAGAFAYYLHDKNAMTTERVAWTQCLNLMTECVEKAWKRMAYTAMNQKELKQASGQRTTGAKMHKPVFAYSLSWHPEQNPSQQSMMEAVMETLNTLGLSEHQAIVSAHRDEPHPHVHVIVNAVNPVTGLVAKLKNTKRKLSKFALNHERKEGKVYCPEREINNANYEMGKKTKHCDPVIAQAWQQSSNGAAFVSILKAHGYQLAKGRRIVVVDPHGNVINPVRELSIKSKEFAVRIMDLDTENLSPVDACMAKREQSMPARKRMVSAVQLRPELIALEAKISDLKCRLRSGGTLAGCFGISAYRKRKLVRLCRDFRAMSILGSQTHPNQSGFQPVLED